ncbi:MAG: hypothetical protein WB239_05315 [Acidimicrobiia bacterium]
MTDLYLSLCEQGPTEVERVGPFANIEIYKLSWTVAVQRPNSEAWEEIDLTPWHAVFIESEPRP